MWVVASSHPSNTPRDVLLALLGCDGAVALADGSRNKKEQRDATPKRPDLHERRRLKKL